MVLTTQQLNLLEKSYKEIHALQHLEFALFILGSLYNSKNPIKLSLLFEQTATFYGNKPYNLDLIKKAFIELRNSKIVLVNMKIDSAYASLTDIGQQISFLTVQKILQKNSLN